MIPKHFLLAFLSIQSSNNPRTCKHNSAPDVVVQVDVLNEPAATTFQLVEVGAIKPINEIEYLSTPSTQISGNDAQVPIQIPTGKEVVIQRGSKEINVTAPNPLYIPLPLSLKTIYVCV